MRILPNSLENTMVESFDGLSPSRLAREPILILSQGSRISFGEGQVATIHSFEGSSVSRVRRRESDERSFLSLRIK
jgi:hypothetical protein